jgi:hypothetical protein
MLLRKALAHAHAHAHPYTSTHIHPRSHPPARSYAKFPVMLRYTACQGLFNQMYAHLNALVLADYLGADVVLPPSVYRCVCFEGEARSGGCRGCPFGVCWQRRG